MIDIESYSLYIATPLRKNIEQILLADFKSEFDLSNKKWDKILKELRGNDLVDIFKSDDGNLFIKPI